LGIGDWGLGIGPIPNPQSPIPRSILLIHKIKNYIYEAKNVKKSKIIYPNNFINNLTYYYEYLQNKVTNKSKNKNSNFNHKNEKFKFKESSFLWFSKLDTTCRALEFSVNEISQLYENYISKDRTEIFSFSKEIYSLKELIRNNILYLSAGNAEVENNFRNFTSSNNYTLYSMKYIYDKLFNPIDDIIHDTCHFEENLEFMTNSFEHDKLITITFNYENKEMKLTRCNKELNNFRGKLLEDLFPQEICKEGKEIFIEKIFNSESNRFNFEFYFSQNNCMTNFEKNNLDKNKNKNDNDKFIQVIKMDCLICFTLDLSEFLIIAKYDIVRNEDILMVKVHNSNYEAKEAIVNFSPSIGEFLFINVDVIEYITDLGKFFYLEEIFTKSKKFQKSNTCENLEINNFCKKQEKFSEDEMLNSTTTKFDNKTQNSVNFVYQFNLQKYHKYYNEKFKIVFKYYKEKNFQNEKEFFTLMNKLSEKISIHYSQNIFEFIMSEKEIIKNYKIYTFQNLGKKIKNLNAINTVNNHVDPDRSNLNIDHIENNSQFLELEKLQTNPFTTGTISSTLLGSSQNALFLDPKYKKNGQSKYNLPLGNTNCNNMYKIDEEKNKNLKKLTRYLILASFLIITYSLTIMKIGLDNNQKLNQIIDIKTQLNSVEILFYHTTTNVLSKLKIVKNNENFSLSGGDKNISSNIQNLNSTINSINLLDFLDKEISAKYDAFLKRLESFHKIYYSSYFSRDIEKIINKSQQYYTLSLIGNEIKISSDQSQNSKFIEISRIFMNKLQSTATKSITNIEEYYIYINMLNLNNNFDFSSFSNQYTRNEVIIYELFLNYRNIEQGFSKVTKSVNNLYIEFIHYVFFQNLIFSIILIISHFVLLLIGVKLIFHFKRIMEHFALMTNELITGSKENFKYMKNKIEILKNISYMYQESPQKSIKNLKQIKKDLIDAEKLKKARSPVNINYQRNQIFTEKYFNKFDRIYYVNIKEHLLSPIKIISLSFSIFLIYSTVCIFMVLNFTTTIDLTNEYIEANESIFKDVINNYNLLQLEVYTNTIDEGYVFNSNRNLMENFSELKNYRKYGKIFASIFELRKKINCESLYKLTDPIWSKFTDKFNKDEIFAIFSEICGNFHLLDPNANDITLLEEISIHHLLKLNNKIEKSIGNFTLLYELFDDPSFFELFKIINFIFRPYYAHITLILLPEILKSNFESLTKFMTVYLSLNIFMDVMIIVVLYVWVIRKIEKSNTEINSFLCIIKFI
jgi:hypothetical protein